MDIKDGCVVWQVNKFVDGLSTAAKLNLIHYLCADKQMITAAIGSVMDEWFFDDVEVEGLEGGWWNNMSRELLGKLIPLMPDASKRLIAQLLTQLREAEYQRRRHDQWAWALYRKLGASGISDRPKISEFENQGHWKDLMLEAEQRLAEEKV